MPVHIKDVLPLKVPLVIFIDPSNICNFKCVFCPTGDDELLKSVNRPKGMMSLDLFKRIVDDLDKMVQKYNSKPAQISLFKDGEPLLNKNLPEMIKILAEKKFNDTLEITTNASALTEDNAEKIIKAGLKKIRYSIYHLNDEGYMKVTSNKINFKKIHENVKNFWKIKKKLNSNIHVTAKILNYDLSKEQEKFFKESFGPYSDHTEIEYVHGWSNSDLKDFKEGKNLDKTFQGKEYIHKKICSQPFSRMTILFNGDVTPCCVDWSHKLVSGNLNDYTLDEIWNKKSNKLRNDHINGNIKKDSPCYDCNYMLGMKHGDLENIDSISEKLKGMYP